MVYDCDLFANISGKAAPSRFIEYHFIANKKLYVGDGVAEVKKCN